MSGAASPCYSESLSILSTETEACLEGSQSSTSPGPMSGADEGNLGCCSHANTLGPDNRALVRMFRQQSALEQKLQLEQRNLLSTRPTDPGARMIVVSWMVEVAEEFRLQQETLHASVLLLDRFLGASAEEVPRCVLQLLAVGCILLASKDLEVSQPTVEQLCAVTANHFQPSDLLRMERIILNVLDFGLSGPTCYTFLHLLAQVCSGVVTPAVLSLAMYLCELSMLDACTLSFSYSTKAAAALLLAHVCLGDPQHTACMEAAVASCMGADGLQGLTPCMAVLLRLQQIAYQHTVASTAAATAAAAAGAVQVAAARTGAVPRPAPTAAVAPPPEDLLGPLRVKFGAPCWCAVSTAPPLVPLMPAQD